MRTAPCPVLALTLFAGACVTPAPAPAEASGVPAAESSARQQAQAAATNETAQEARTEEQTGTLVPASYEALSLWPEEYAGELLVLEALAQGARVAEGDTLVRLDTERFDEQLRDAELDLRSTELAHAGLLEKNTLAAEAAADELDRARARLDRARRSLEGYKSQELAFDRRSDALRAQREQHGIEDRLDELAQVEAMYEADELVDATEEIVLKRSRRDLEATRAATALSADRRAYEQELERPMQLEAREEDVAMQAAALARLERSQAIDARAREDAAQRSAVALEKKRRQLEGLRADAGLFALRAPRDGVLLYGKADDYRSGGKPSVPERGSRLSARSDVLLVADPEEMAVALDIPESGVAAVRSGAKIGVRPLARPDTELQGVLSVEAFPAARGGGKDGGVFAATVTLPSGDHGLVFGMHARVALPVPEKAGK